MTSDELKIALIKEFIKPQPEPFVIDEPFTAACKSKFWGDVLSLAECHISLWTSNRIAMNVDIGAYTGRLIPVYDYKRVFNAINDMAADWLNEYGIPFSRSEDYYIVLLKDLREFCGVDTLGVLA